MIDLSKCSLLIVDDTETNIDILLEALSTITGDISVALDGVTALELAQEYPPDLILLDIMMPGIDGYEVCRRFKADPALCDIPIIFITAMSEIDNKTRGFELGAVDYITKPFEVVEVRARVKTHLALQKARDVLARQNELLEIKVRERTHELAMTQEVTIESMAALAEYRDPETGGHIQRTKNYVRVLARRLQNQPRFKDILTDEVIELLYLSAPLHDIGKVGIRDHILLKPGKLTDEEFEEMKRHTVYGRDALKVAADKLGDNSFLRFAMEIAYSHQEKWDGSGYPEGLKGEAIPVSGRLMALADVYDALISKRVYKPPFTHQRAVEIILQGKNAHFDPEMTDAFMEIQEEFRQIALRFVDFEEERVTLSEPYQDFRSDSKPFGVSRRTPNFFR
ncbi:MAG: two-component system response regulator [Synechococcaceae cyanobacterium SM1_2_3]|nr:two-component system response regulator [Synechococcaceae cyanobacterium SM1_2_3]